jgi:hypothetical protein
MRVRTIGFTLAVAIGIAWTPGEAGTTGDCPGDQLAQLLSSVPYVEVSVARGLAIPSGRWPRYQGLAMAVLACLRPGTHLTIRAIGPNSVAIPPLFAKTVPVGTDGANPLLPRIARRQFTVAALAAVNTLPMSLAEDDGTYDPLGALTAAGTDFAAMGTEAGRAIVLIFNGWLQSRSINLFSYGSNPRRMAEVVIARLRGDRIMPDLHGSRVLIAGITPGDPRMRADDGQLVQLCGFWNLVIDAAHGQLLACGASLPGVAVAQPAP